MFVPIYKGSAGHALVCIICSQVTPIDDASARGLLLRHLGSEDVRLYESPHMQSAAERIGAARILMAYLQSDQCRDDLEPMVTAEMSEALIEARLNHCMAWRLSQELAIPFSDAEVIMHEDRFRPAFYVDDDLQVRVDAVDLDRKIASTRRQA
jgi:hypothetical protein